MKNTRTFLALLAAAILTGFFAARFPTASAADPYPTATFNLSSPAVHLTPLTTTNGLISDVNEIPVSRSLLTGGAGNVVAIGQNDGTNLVGASAANAGTLTVGTVNYNSYLPAYSSSTPGQYIIVNDGTNAAEIISGYLTGSTLTVTTGGGAGANTTANAHKDGTLIAAYAPLIGLSAGQTIPIRAKRVMNTNTTATNIVELW